MRPRLLRVSNGLPTEILLDSAGLTLGRDASNTLAIDDPVVSSRHCKIEWENAGFVLADCESLNGTFVNRKTVTRAALKHGDEILVGHARFYFLVEEELAFEAPEVCIDDPQDRLISSETIHLNPAESAYLRKRFTEDAQLLPRMARDMSLLLRLSAEIHNILDSTELQHVLLERIFERIPAENGAILLGTRLDQLFAPTNVSRQSSLAAPVLRVSRTIVQRVFDSSESLLRSDLMTDEQTSESVRALNLRSVLCVPLTVAENRIGVLYLSTTDPAAPFDSRHLELATAIASIAAVALEHARYVEWLEVENRYLDHNASLSHDMVGQNPKMQSVYDAIALLAPTDSPVLILGESGTGKELAARAIHNNSKRRNGPFIAVNCGAVSETLFASQLFGHVKGAFTGADRDQKGFIEEADGGTLFLDELGDLPLHCQAALLRVLEEARIRRVGSSRETTVDVRIVSATNRPLDEEIHKGNFRSDLFFRMGLTVELPPLRERLDDIPFLVKFFVQKYKSLTQREIGATPPETIRALQQYHWPGNVRELGRAIHWAMIFGKMDRIRPEDLPREVLKSGSPASGARGLEEALESHERQLIAKALEETHGNVVEAAALLARAPNYLQRRISQLKLREQLENIRKTAT